MSNETNTIKEDIAFMRRLAEKGRRGPILGGTFLAAAGLVFGAGCFVQWAGQAGMLPITGWDVLWIWGVAFAVFAVIWLALFVRLKGTAPCAGAANDAFGVAWSACAVGTLSAFASVIIVANVTGAPVVLDAYLPVIFAFYGAAWATSAAIARRHWMFVPAAGAFVFALVMAELAASPFQIAAMGAALLLLLTAPGFWLVYEEARP